LGRVNGFFERLELQIRISNNLELEYNRESMKLDKEKVESLLENHLIQEILSMKETVLQAAKEYLEKKA